MSFRVLRKHDFLRRPTYQRARRIALDGFRQRAQVTSGHPQVLEDRPHIVLIVPEHAVEALDRFVDVPDDLIQLARFADLAQALGEGRYVVHRLLQTRVREQLVEPAEADASFCTVSSIGAPATIRSTRSIVRRALLSAPSNSVEISATGTLSSLALRSTTNLFRFWPRSLTSAWFRLAIKR